MKNFTRNTLMIVTLLGLNASYATAGINAYAFDKTTKGAVQYSKFKEGDFNPYWFEETALEAYAYDVLEGTPLHREFVQGDFNPYWFEESTPEAYAYEVLEGTSLRIEVQQG